MRFQAPNMRTGLRILTVALTIIMTATMFVSSAFAQSTYTYSGNPFDTVQGAYTTAHQVSGGFTLPTRLMPNLPANTDISAQVLSYRFNDGVPTLTEGDLLEGGCDSLQQLALGHLAEAGIRLGWREGETHA